MTSGIDLDRRRFLRGRFAAAEPVIRPPWSRPATIAAACTGCGDCAMACPQAIIKSDDNGQPTIDFHAKECTFCGRCAEACSEAVFDRMAVAFRHVVVIGERCFTALGVVCQSCGDACPEGAIRFRPRIGGPALPSLATDRCTGCGACIAVCPANAIGPLFPAAEANHA